MSYQKIVNYIKMINDIKRDLNLLKEYDIHFEYQNGLGFICSSPFFFNFYFLIVLFDGGYQIRTYRNGLLEYNFKEREYFSYFLIKDIINIINKEIQYEFQ